MRLSPLRWAGNAEPAPLGRHECTSDSDTATAADAAASTVATAPTRWSSRAGFLYFDGAHVQREIELGTEVRC